MLKKVMITKQLWVYVCGQKVRSISQEKQKRQKSEWKDKENKFAWMGEECRRETKVGK